MRAVVQRVREASVTVDGDVIGAIRVGLLVLLGIHQDDGDSDLEYLADKVLGLRIFPDGAGRMNRSVLEAGGEILVISQFTLYGDCRKGRRPSFVQAARPEVAKTLYNGWLERLRQAGVGTHEGVFGAKMAVHLVNDGPVTVLLDSRRTF